MRWSERILNELAFPIHLEGDNMSDEIGGSIVHGKTNVVVAQFKGKLTNAEWEEFKECIAACLKRYQGRVSFEVKGSKPPQP